MHLIKKYRLVACQTSGITGSYGCPTVWTTQSSPTLTSDLIFWSLLWLCLEQSHSILNVHTPRWCLKTLQCKGDQTRSTGWWSSKNRGKQRCDSLGSKSQHFQCPVLMSFIQSTQNKCAQWAPCQSIYRLWAAEAQGWAMRKDSQSWDWSSINTLLAVAI